MKLNVCVHGALGNVLSLRGPISRSRRADALQHIFTLRGTLSSSVMGVLSLPVMKTVGSGHDLDEAPVPEEAVRVTLENEGRKATITCRRSSLVENSDYFRAMLAAPYLESAMDHVQVTVPSGNRACV